MKTIGHFDKIAKSSAQIDPAEVLREIAGKIWCCPISKIREGMREANINGCTKFLLIMTPAGLFTATFLTSPRQVGILINRPKHPGYFSFEFLMDDFLSEVNQGKELNAIAKMSCDWQDDR